VESGRVITRAQAHGSGVALVTRCGHGVGTAADGKRRAVSSNAARMVALSGRVSRVNPLGYDLVSVGGAGLSWLGQDKAS
jgi:hypothetical protein